MQLLHEATISNGADASADACARSLLDGLPPVMWFIRRQMRKHRTHRLSVPQFRTLVLLDQFPTATLSAVAEQLGATLPTASRMVAGLVSRGLVVRKGCPDDRRRMSLVLTPKGRRAFESARMETQRTVASEIESLTGSQRARVIEAMDLLKGIFSQALPDRVGGNGQPANASHQRKVLQRN